MRITSLLFVLSICAACSGCSTERLLKRQQLQLLSSELTYLDQTKALLLQTPDPELAGDLSVFISAGTLNAIFAAADGTSASIPSVSGATLHVNSVRAQFSDGLPVLNVSAWANKGSLRLDVSITAVLEPVAGAASLPNMQFRVAIQQVVPVLHWGIFQLPKFIFVEQLLHVEAEKYAESLPAITVPLSANFDLNLPASQNQVVIPTDNGQGHLYGNLSLPGFDLAGAIVIDRVLFLHDGLHIYAHIQA